MASSLRHQHRWHGPSGAVTARLYSSSARHAPPPSSSIATGSSLSSHGEASTSQPPHPQHRIDLVPATDAAALRAAAYLRAYSFYTYPEDRSPWSARAHRRMKGDAEWETLTQKVSGTESNYKNMRVSCFVATVADDPECEVAREVGKEMDLSTKIPSSSSGSLSSQEEEAALPRLVIGTLDLNIGAVLPAEELVGRFPAENPATRRAYLSNVCVSKAARRRGVARDLIHRAEEAARAAGVEGLYVHVVHDNEPAIKLYTNLLGFSLESEEGAGFAKSLQRPRRLLLCKKLKP